MPSVPLSSIWPGCRNEPTRVAQAVLLAEAQREARVGRPPEDLVGDQQRSVVRDRDRAAACGARRRSIALALSGVSKRSSAARRRPVRDRARACNGAGDFQPPNSSSISARTAAASKSPTTAISPWLAPTNREWKRRTSSTRDLGEVRELLVERGRVAHVAAADTGLSCRAERALRDRRRLGARSLRDPSRSRASACRTRAAGKPACAVPRRRAAAPPATLSRTVSPLAAVDRLATPTARASRAADRARPRTPGGRASAFRARASRPSRLPAGIVPNRLFSSPWCRRSAKRTVAAARLLRQQRDLESARQRDSAACAPRGSPASDRRPRPRRPTCRPCSPSPARRRRPAAARARDRGSASGTNVPTVRFAGLRHASATRCTSAAVSLRQ